MKEITIADLFCGAGGTTTGAIHAAQDLGYSPRIFAVNHWKTAVATHAQNYPEHEHLISSVDNVNPRHYFDRGELDVLWASPECMHHSRARGGKPINDQSRATAMCVIRWAEALTPGVILVENVPEFVDWGPLIETQVGEDLLGPVYEYKPDPKRKGEIFKQWVRMLETIGYTVEWDVFCCANYGDPTTRRRLIIQAVYGGRKIHWPRHTHNEDGEGLPRWIPARDIIDWSIPSQSIYTRERPLKPKTIERIYAGFFKYGIDPYILPQQRGGRQVHGTDEPIATLTATSRGVGLCQPYLTILRNNMDARSIDDPVPTLTSGGGHQALTVPFLLRYNDHGRVQPIDAPVSTLDTSNRLGLVEPYMVGVNHTGGDRSMSMDDPLKTLTSKGFAGLVRPYLIKFYGKGHYAPLEDPTPTITTKERFGLVIPSVGEKQDDVYMIDFLFRMLQVPELARAHSFPDDYKFAGTKTDQVKQIGNSVPCGMARSMFRASVGQAA